MRTTQRRIVTGALMLATATVLGGLRVASAGAPGGAIRVDYPGGQPHVHNDFDHDGRFDMGDRFVGRGRLVDPSSGGDVGQAFWDCVAMTRIRVEANQGTWLCTALLRFADGDLTLQGPDPAGYGAATMAVTGGTGLYRDARGGAEVIDVAGPDRTEITIHLEP